MKILYTIPFTVMLSVTGCGSQDTNVSEAEPNKNNETPIHKQYVSPLADDAPVYKVVTTGAQPPFSFKNEYGNLQGIDIDVMRLIGEEQGFKVEFQTDDWVNVFPSVVDGRRDLAISGISYNDERADKYLLSKSYLFVPSAIMYNSQDLNIKGIQDLQGLRYAGMEGSKQLNDVKNNVDNVTFIETKTMFSAYQEMIRGNADAIAEDIHWLQHTAQSYPEVKIKIVAYETENDPASQQIIMFKKGNTKLANTVNEGIDKLIAKGKIKEIEEKWIKQ